MKTQDVNELLEEAKAEISNVPKGKRFLVKDLFRGYIWTDIERGKRLLLGTLFLNYANSREGVSKIQLDGKSTAHQQYYKKI